MEIRKTDDGSQTLWSADYKETYHSIYGAETESTHVFIEAGLKQSQANPLYVFEMGFGTGLNALLTLKESLSQNLKIIYHAVELHPVLPAVYSKLEVEREYRDVFLKMHQAEWNKEVQVTPNFVLKKIHESLNNWQTNELYNVIYFDAFSPETQPDLWTQKIFEKMFHILKPGGILTTYCAKGIVRRNMIASGFKTERLPGPPGKREMLRARK